MLYRNRMLESGTDSMIDKVFLKYIDGYGMSSNRLEYAVNSFSYPKCAEIISEVRRNIWRLLHLRNEPAALIGPAAAVDRGRHRRQLTLRRIRHDTCIRLSRRRRSFSTRRGTPRRSCAEGSSIRICAWSVPLTTFRCSSTLGKSVRYYGKLRVPGLVRDFHGGGDCGKIFAPRRL